MTDEEFSESLRQTLRDIDVPPAPPREEMWARIQAERSARRGNGGAATETRDTMTPDTGRDVIDIRPRRRVHVWVQLSAALAAMLVIGIGIGRFTGNTSAEPAAVAATHTPAGSSMYPYRLATAQHMSRTETLLTSLEVDEDTRSMSEMQMWASDLLTNTRLLLSSPAADDPDARKLLEDLELVLSRIAVIPSAQAQEEVKLIKDELNQSDVLLRVRAATAGPRLVGT